jgi:hypothetical protein
MRQLQVVGSLDATVLPAVQQTLPACRDTTWRAFTAATPHLRASDLVRREVDRGQGLGSPGKAVRVDGPVRRLRSVAAEEVVCLHPLLSDDRRSE